MKTFLIVNPVSGKGEGSRLATSLGERLRTAGESVAVIETHPDMDRFRQACEAVCAEDRVVVIGGDGTFHYFLNAGVPFGQAAFYGMGTANVITVEFGLPSELDAFVAMLRTGHTVPCLPGRTDDGTRFFMMYSFGIDAHVLTQVPQKLKNRIGKAAFSVALAKSLFGYDYPPCALVLDDGRRIECTFAIISRFKHYGGAYAVTANADPESARFAIVAQPRGGWRPAMGMLWRAWRRQLDRDPGLIFAESSSVRLEWPDTPPPGQLDGDLFARPVRELTVCDRPVPLIVPAQLPS
ncbi:DAGKc domain-containing protein [Sulfidibacter corallicola]|uniref:DAGKc domain-containing protein n=1 Tax=Sulfidibacter corallicola TaxID=2818388 RepID=A0A8A4TQ73_SULCO|nr:diacylglycerol kinase family protein [Sulfidibacter corallicola]QTD51232.1 hypothetical protein J3U87_02080 [Sulfidibacter corallicola]